MKNPKFLFFVCAILFFGKINSQTWTAHNAGIINVIYNISFPTNDTGYVVSDQGEIRKTTDGAISWTIVSPPALIGPIFFVSGLTGFVCGDSSIYKTANGGATWSEVLHDNQVIFSSIYFVDALNGFAGGFKYTGDSVRLYKTSNGGLTWSHINSMADFFPDQALYFYNSTTGFWANNFNIFSTSNGGASFNNVYNDISMSDYVVNLSFPNIDTGFAVGSQSAFLKSTDGGASWSQTTYPGGATYDIYFFDGRKGFACGGNGASAGWVQQTSNAGASWTPSYLSAYTFDCMDFPSDTVGYVGGQNGTVLKFTGTPNGIAENEGQLRLSIFPNPASGSITINNIIPGSKITLINLAGQIIEELIAENSIAKMSLENVAAGIYFIEMESAGEKIVQKLIVN